MRVKRLVIFVVVVVGTHWNSFSLPDSSISAVTPLVCGEYRCHHVFWWWEEGSFQGQ